VRNAGLLSGLVTESGWEPVRGHHYTVDELAQEWNLSADFIRRAFGGEPGVVIFSQHRPGRRLYRTIRIPAAVAERVYRRSRLG
jgi:hypothetical protein